MIGIYNIIMERGGSKKVCFCSFGYILYSCLFYDKGHPHSYSKQRQLLKRRRPLGVNFSLKNV